MATTTLKGVLRTMLQLDPALGRSEALGSLTTQTAVVTNLAAGGSGQRFVDHWMLRSDSTVTADRIRRVTAYAPATGTLTHAGTAYSDTTATGETLDILEHEPYLFHNAIQITLPRLKNMDTTHLPTAQSQRRVWLGDLDWVLEPSDVMSISWSNNPVISRNRYFEKYNTYDTSGVLKPDFWTLTGAGATMARSTVQNNRSRNSLAITRAGTDCTVSQAVTILPNGVSGQNLSSQSVVGVAVVWASVGSQVRVQVNDNVTTTSSSYHTGTSNWQEVTVAKVLAATATNVTVQVSVEGSNNVCYVDECYIVEAASLDDAVRRDNYQESLVHKNDWTQDGTLATYLPERGRRGQWVVKSQRGYPQLDTTRFAAGTADSDTIDADVIKVATGAIGRLYESLAEMSAENEGRYGPLAGMWLSRFDTLATLHQAVDRSYRPMGALNHTLQLLSPPASRYGGYRGRR